MTEESKDTLEIYYEKHGRLPVNTIPDEPKDVGYFSLDTLKIEEKNNG